MIDKLKISNILNLLYISRFTDEKMNKLVLQNMGTSFFLSNQGHELIGILTASKLNPKKDFFFPYYRDRAFVIAIGSCLLDLFASFLARDSKHHSSGRMMPDHFSDIDLNITCQSSCVGSQYIQAVGVAKGIDSNEIVYVSGGDGSTSQGDFHEALNFSSIHKLSVLFVIQNNNIAISTRSNEQTAGSISKVFSGYENLKVFDVDGTNFIETENALDDAIKYLRDKKGPVLFVANVPRIKSHSISDDPKKYLTDEEIKLQNEKDPMLLFEDFIKKEKILSIDEIEKIKKDAHTLVENSAEDAKKVLPPNNETIEKNLFKDHKILEVEKLLDNKITYMDAINHALKEEMEDDSSIILFGQDVQDKKGGVFGITKGISDKFLKKRCFNTPLAESTIIGLAIGLTYVNKKPICEIQFADYTMTALNQLLNELPSIHYRSNGEFLCPVVVRIPYGGYIQGGPYHSQSIETILCHTPGLKVVAPSNAKDAKMLLKAAIRDPNPVIFLEHKALYRQNFAKSNEPTKDSILSIGKASIVNEGEDITIVTYGLMVHFANDIAKKLKNENISIEIIDLRTLVPLDIETIINSIKKTSKLLILHEDRKFLGFGAEIAAIVSERAFQYLDGPIKRIGALDIPIPYAKNLEDLYFPQKEKIEEEIKKLISY